MKITKFENNLFELEVKTVDNECLFDAENVAECLGFTQTKNDKTYVRWETVNKYIKKYVSQEVGKGDYIPEPLVYKLIFKANNTLAEKFQDWLAIEVLPSIRKHGMYATDQLLNNPDLLIKLATELKKERQEKMILTQRIAEYEPKATYVDKILKSKNVVCTSQIASDYGMSAQKLNKFLKDNGVQKKIGGQWLLRSRYMNLGYTKSETIDVNGVSRINTKWTQKGRLFIHNLLIQKGVIVDE